MSPFWRGFCDGFVKGSLLLLLPWLILIAILLFW